MVKQKMLPTTLSGEEPDIETVQQDSTNYGTVHSAECHGGDIDTAGLRKLPRCDLISNTNTSWNQAPGYSKASVTSNCSMKTMSNLPILESLVNITVMQQTEVATDSHQRTD